MATTAPAKALTWRKDFYYDRKAAKRAVHFFENELQHVQGEYDKIRFQLEKWELRLVRRIFGWKRRKDNSRKFRKVFLFVPSGNGKSFVVAGIGTYLFAADKEPGANVITAAADTEQAEIVFKYAKENVHRNPKLKELVGRIYRRSMAILTTGSSYKVISSAAETKHGMDLHGVLVDEVHALKNRQLVDVLITRTRTRRQPLIVFATTAGYDKRSVCGDLYDYSKKILEGIIVDHEFYPVIYEATEQDDWTSEKVWHKANPNLGVTVNVDFLRAQCVMAKQMPTYENAFKRMHLNIWTASDIRWLPMHKWGECNEKIDDAILRTTPCFGGLDLAGRLDVAAFVLVFPLENDRWATLCRFWIPEATAEKRQRSGQVPYLDWARDGLISLTPGDDIDYAFLRRDIKKLSEDYLLRAVAFDPWNANQLTHQLNDEDGIVMIPCRQGYQSLSAPSKELEAAVTSGRLAHGDNPVLTWMASNATVVMDPAGNIRPDKSKSRDKIDGILALVMALGRILVDDQSGRSVYDERGVIVV